MVPRSGLMPPHRLGKPTTLICISDSFFCLFVCYSFIHSLVDLVQFFQCSRLCRSLESTPSPNQDIMIPLVLAVSDKCIHNLSQRTQSSVSLCTLISLFTLLCEVSIRQEARSPGEVTNEVKLRWRQFSSLALAVTQARGSSTEREAASDLLVDLSLLACSWSSLFSEPQSTRDLPPKEKREAGEEDPMSSSQWRAVLSATLQSAAAQSRASRGWLSSR